MIFSKFNTVYFQTTHTHKVLAITFFALFYFFSGFSQCPGINEQNSGLTGTNEPIPGCSEFKFCISVVNPEDEEMTGITITFTGHEDFEALNAGGFSQVGTTGVWNQTVNIPPTTEVTFCITFKLSADWTDDPTNKIFPKAELSYLNCDFGEPFDFQTVIPDFPFVTIGTDPVRTNQCFSNCNFYRYRRSRKPRAGHFKYFIYTILVSLQCAEDFG